MKIKKGQKLIVKHSRKGTFNGIAMKTFDIKKEEFYPIALDQEKTLHGASMLNDWEKGEEVPCRDCLCKLKLRK